jgi:hypothetical protein
MAKPSQNIGYLPFSSPSLLSLRIAFTHSTAFAFAQEFSSGHRCISEWIDGRRICSGTYFDCDSLTAEIWPRAAPARPEQIQQSFRGRPALAGVRVDLVGTALSEASYSRGHVSDVGRLGDSAHLRSEGSRPLDACAGKLPVFARCDHGVAPLNLPDQQG